MTRSADPAALEARLGYRFCDRALLTEALTHVSRPGASYQRLEFLGDRVLGLAVADMLMEAFPESSEGDLSRRLSELVRRETCSSVAESWEVGDHLRLGGGAKASMRRNPSILADVFEAVIGAVFQDGGFAAARDLVRRAFADRLPALSVIPANPKTMLQEWAAARGRPPPVYTVREKSGPDHAPRFQVDAKVDGLQAATGAGTSRRAAEQAAAEAVLVREGVTVPAITAVVALPEDARVDA